MSIATNWFLTVSDFHLDDFLPYQLAVIAERVSREFAASYRDKFGISRSEWRVIVHIWAAAPVSVREVHKRVDMDKSKVSRAASRLEEAGLITKTQDDADRRLLKLELTAQGRSMMAELLPLAAKYEAELMARLGDEADTFRRLLKTLLVETP
ncbi:MAG: MarR family transcriptional regulator [Pseudomonadota bacterium]